MRTQPSATSRDDLARISLHQLAAICRHGYFGVEAFSSALRLAMPYSEERGGGGTGVRQVRCDALQVVERSVQLRAPNPTWTHNWDKLPRHVTPLSAYGHLWVIRENLALEPDALTLQTSSLSRVLDPTSLPYVGRRRGLPPAVIVDWSESSSCLRLWGDGGESPERSKIPGQKSKHALEPPFPSHSFASSPQT